MNPQTLINKLVLETDSKIIMLVIDGLGGLPAAETGRTELEMADLPNLDNLATHSICGMIDMVAPGITPGSAPGHLALFGYDPEDSLIGRGVLEALGIDFDFKKGDVAARGNFCTIDNNNLITDRRAGRLATEKNTELCKLLDGHEIDGVKIIVKPVKDHRLVVVLRGEGLSASLSDTDPQRLGDKPLKVVSYEAKADKTAAVIAKFNKRVANILNRQSTANMVLLRGFSMLPNHSSMKEVYKLKTAAIASYPMYRGLAKVIGMDVLDTGETLEAGIETIRNNFNEYDFFFIHFKATDAAGEDGDFNRKVAALEEVDDAIGGLLNLKPQVIIVTGDHSTPAVLSGHGWHTVPVMLHSKYCRPDDVKAFSEKECIKGGLGRMAAINIMPLALANAFKLRKFGA